MMTQTDYFEGVNTTERIPGIPSLVRAVLIMLLLNILVAFWFYFSPDIFSPQAAAPTIKHAKPVVAGKTSPFAPVIPETPRRVLKMPVKIEPVFEAVENTLTPAYGN
jgi:hypothetical protein